LIVDVGRQIISTLATGSTASAQFLFWVRVLFLIVPTIVVFLDRRSA
jgi:hypothetical protein